MENYIAWIPARGGSKRLPKKNIMDFCGKPLISYSIESALTCSGISSVFVSTDDPEIEEVSRFYGAQVIQRPSEFATDEASTAMAAQHLLSFLGIKSNNELGGLVTLQPTQPLRSPELLSICIAEFEKANQDRIRDSLITVSTNRLKIGRIQEGNFKPLTYTIGQRSQDMEISFYENGLVYITKPEMIVNKDIIFDSDVVPLIIDDDFSRIDIDDELDFKIAETIFQYYLNKKR